MLASLQFFGKPGVAGMTTENLDYIYYTMQSLLL